MVRSRFFFSIRKALANGKHKFVKKNFRLSPDPALKIVEEIKARDRVSFNIKDVLTLLF